MEKNYLEKNTNKIFTKESYCTIPNYITTFRILLVPFIIYFYLKLENKIVTLILVSLSGLSDILDGYIARKYNKTSAFGIVFDPISDKLTQLAILICLIKNFPRLLKLVILFGIKELTQGLFALYMVNKTNKITMANWYGKLSSTVLFASMLVFIFFPNMNNTLSEIIIYICILVLLMSLILYIRFFLKTIKENRKE